jgi:hypothetical protein
MLKQQKQSCAHLDLSCISCGSWFNYFLWSFSLVVCFFLPASLLAGPPFRTDDPEPVEHHHWEFYLGSQITNAPEDVSGTAPHVEINYGIFPETQLHVIVPLFINHPQTGNSAYGAGDMELGLKYRLVKEKSSIPQIGVFPLLEVPTGNADKGLGAGNTQLFLPIWLQKSWGPWTTYGGGGYLANLMSNPVNSWFIGWEGQRDLSEAVTLGAELFGTIIPSQTSENELAFNIGAIINISDQHHLLFSAGRDIVGHNNLYLYAAYQLTIGPETK